MVPSLVETDAFNLAAVLLAEADHAFFNPRRNAATTDLDLADLALGRGSSALNR